MERPVQEGGGDEVDHGQSRREGKSKSSVVDPEMETNGGIVGKISGFAQWCVEIDGGAKGVAAAVSIIETESSSHGKEFALRRA